MAKRKAEAPKWSLIGYFFAVPIACTWWVQSTIKLLCAVHTLSSALSINSSLSEMKTLEPWVKPRMVGHEARKLPLCYAAPPLDKTFCKLLGPQNDVGHYKNVQPPLRPYKNSLSTPNLQLSYRGSCWKALCSHLSHNNFFSAKVFRAYARPFLFFLSPEGEVCLFVALIEFLVWQNKQKKYRLSFFSTKNRQEARARHFYPDN